MMGKASPKPPAQATSLAIPPPPSPLTASGVQPSAEDRAWAKQYGEGGAAPSSLKIERKAGKSKDELIIDAAMNAADQGKPVTGNALRKR